MYCDFTSKLNAVGCFKSCIIKLRNTSCFRSLGVMLIPLTIPGRPFPYTKNVDCLATKKKKK